MATIDTISSPRALRTTQGNHDTAAPSGVRPSSVRRLSLKHNIKGNERILMEKNYSEFTKRISVDLRKLRKDIPDTMQAFSALAQAATRGGALDNKTKELIALALGVAARCDGCIGFHTEALVKLRATRQEVEETLGMAIYMGGGPSLMYAADAISAYEQFEKQLNVVA